MINPPILGDKIVYSQITRLSYSTLDLDIISMEAELSDEQDYQLAELIAITDQNLVIVK